MKIQFSYLEFLEIDKIKFMILSKLNDSLQICNPVINLYDFYLKSCIEKNLFVLGNEDIPETYYLSRNANIFCQIFLEIPYTMKNRLERDINNKKNTYVCEQKK